MKPGLHLTPEAGPGLPATYQFPAGPTTPPVGRPAVPPSATGASRKGSHPMLRPRPSADRYTLASSREIDEWEMAPPQALPRFEAAQLRASLPAPRSHQWAPPVPLGDSFSKLRGVRGRQRPRPPTSSFGGVHFFHGRVRPTILHRRHQRVHPPDPNAGFLMADMAIFPDHVEEVLGVPSPASHRRPSSLCHHVT